MARCDPPEARQVNPFSFINMKCEGLLTGPASTHKLVDALEQFPIVIRPRLTVAVIQREVADYFDMPLIDMVSARRGREVARPRQVAMYLARMLTLKSLPSIGALFGRRDHTTVLHAIRQIERLRMVDDNIARALTLLTASLKP